MNPQDIGALLSLAAVVGGCFALAFIDPWLEQRRCRKWKQSLTSESWVDQDYGKAASADADPSHSHHQPVAGNPANA